MNYYISKVRFQELIEDAYQRGWCSGYAAHMGKIETSSALSFQQDIPQLAAAQFVTTYDFDMRGALKRRHKEFKSKKHGAGK